MTTPGLSKAEILERVKEVLVNQFGICPEQIESHTRVVDDLDLDSIDWIDMAVALEIIMGQELEEDDFASIRTIQDVVDVIHRKVHLEQL